RSKGLVAGAGDDQRLDRAIGVDALADHGHLFVHRKGQRVARLRTVEGHPGDAVIDRVDQVFIGSYGGVHVALFLFFKISGRRYATAAFECGIVTTSRFFRMSMAAITPPVRCGTLARSSPISTPDNAPISIRSLKWPIWAIR